MNDSDLASIIQKIKNKKTDYAPLLPPQKGNKKVLVLDLDETLIHTTFTKPIKYDFESEVLSSLPRFSSTAKTRKFTQ